MNFLDAFTFFLNYEYFYAAILLDNECNTTVNYHVTCSNALNTSVFLSVWTILLLVLLSKE